MRKRQIIYYKFTYESDSGIKDFGEDKWIAYFKNIQCGMFESKEEAEMALLKMMFSGGHGL